MTFLNLRILQNYWNRTVTGSRKKNGFKSTRWSEDYHLMSWTNLTLFDEYLEMGNNKTYN